MEAPMFGSLHLLLCCRGRAGEAGGGVAAAGAGVPDAAQHQHRLRPAARCQGRPRPMDQVRTERPPSCDPAKGPFIFYVRTEGAEGGVG